MNGSVNWCDNSSIPLSAGIKSASGRIANLGTVDILGLDPAILKMSLINSRVVIVGGLGICHA